MTLETCSTPDRGWTGDTRRGASLGRTAVCNDTAAAHKFHLRRVYLDAGGYDPGGAYWGHGAPLYEAFTADGSEYMTLRAWSRDRAKDHVREDYAGAEFYR